MTKKKDSVTGEEQLRAVRATKTQTMIEGGKTIQAESSFVRDIRRLWNQALKNIREPYQSEIKNVC